LSCVLLAGSLPRFDANACRSDEEHNATLGIMMVMFADVRSTDEMIALLRRHAAPVAGAAE
jgi:ureidoacrylate peracid hydrolase